MLSVAWKELGKRYNLKWVFRNFSGEIPAGSHVVVKGSNGSGKSTFGKLIVGATDANGGEIVWAKDGEQVAIDEVPRIIAWSAPFMEVPENMTVSEILEFHCTFRASWEEGYLTNLLDKAGISSHSDEQIKALSSGQKQRLRLILAMGTKSDLVVLDEPCSNLDADGIKWYGEELEKLVKRATVIVCSNNRPEEHLSSAIELHLPSPSVT